MSKETESANFEKSDTKFEIKVYKRRWLIIVLFLFVTIMNQIPVFQFSIIANLVIKYYNVSALAVDWTSIVSMASTVPLALPSAYIIDKWGLRISVLIGAIGTTAGLVTNVFASSRHLFWVILLGQSITAIAQVPLMTLTPRLAAVWFGPDEVSTAASIGVFGLQLGIGFGFLLPSMFVENHDNVDDIGREIVNFQKILVYAMIPITMAILIYFPDRPPLPSSPTQAEELRNKNKKSSKQFNKSVKSLFTNKGFLIHMTAFCINVGVSAAIGTFLNQIVLNYFPNSETDVGRMGFLSVICAVIGSVSFGYILDRAKKFKELTIGVFILAFVGIVLYMFSLESGSKLILYIASGVVGLFTSAYTPVAYQFAIELTYPCPEGTTSGLLASMSQIVGVIFTHILAFLLERTTPFWSLSVLAAFLIIGIIITIFTPNDLRRQAVFKRYKQNADVKFTPVPLEEKTDV